MISTNAYEIYFREGTVKTIVKLLVKLKYSIGFKGSWSSLGRIVQYHLVLDRKEHRQTGEK
jgi:hypothetical protein